MSRTSCKICWTRCVWCARICKCWLRESAVKITNQIIEENKITDKEIYKNIIALTKNIPSKDYIVENMYDVIVKEEKLPKPWWYCEYKKGSVSLGRWAECMRCWKPRFQWQWTLCEALSDNK